MRKSFFTLVAMCMAVAAQATILRVSNVSGSSAPYTSINDAMEVANEGDTIMVDGSRTSYGTINIAKKIVLMGPGYWLVTNDIVKEGANSAPIEKLTVSAEGAVIKGMNVEGEVNINAAKVILQRCYVGSSVKFSSKADNCIIHQNLIEGEIIGDYVQHTQITNNIITAHTYVTDGFIQKFENAYIAYNTLTGRTEGGVCFCLGNLSGCTIENNILAKEHISRTNQQNSLSNNHAFGDNKTIYTNQSTDLTIKETEGSIEGYDGTYGAFAGDDPYVISGIPSGPVIEDLTVPATVEKGSTMNVTIKVGIVK